jgi:hypothetical protein
MGNSFSSDIEVDRLVRKACEMKFVAMIHKNSRAKMPVKFQRHSPTHQPSA